MNQTITTTQSIRYSWNNELVMELLNVYSYKKWSIGRIIIR